MLQKTPAFKDSKSVCEQSHEGSNPPAAPKSRNNLDIVGCKSTVPRCCGFFIFKISEVQKKDAEQEFFKPNGLELWI